MTLASSLRVSRILFFRRRNFDPTPDSLSIQCHKLIYDLESSRNIVDICRIHGYMMKTGLDQDAFATSKLLSFVIHDIRYATSIFECVSNPNLYMFNTMLRGYSISDEPKQAFDCFNSLRSKGLTLDQFSFITSLKACTRELAIGNGQAIHVIVLRSGFLPFTDLKNALLHCYCVCGRISDARRLFDEIPQRNDSVSFNTMMKGYLQVSEPGLVLDLFRRMQDSGLIVNVSTLLSVLPAAGDLGDLTAGKSICGYCIKTGFASDVNLVAALIDMFAKTGNIRLARRIFDGAARKDVVVWNCMIDKYAKTGLLEDCLWLLRQMKYEQAKPNASTFAGLLSCCGSYEAASIGLRVGELVEEAGLAMDAVLGTALVDMYSKLGFLDKAVGIFKKMESKDVKSWTAMISGYGAHGLAREAVTLFYKMEEDKCEEVKPNEITFLVVLNACSHGGLAMEGIKCFKRMVEEYGFMPRIEHYGCVIDLLGRAGLLEEAYDLIRSLPIRSDSTAWRALLAACRVYGDVKLGKRVKMELAEMGEIHPTDSILLSGTYASAGNLQDEQRLLDEGFYKEKKEAGCSTIEME